MRWSASLSLFLLLRASEAVSTKQNTSSDLPTVYLYNPESPSLQSDAQLDNVNAHAASLIFAHRLDISHYLSIGDATDADLEHLNKYITLSKAPSNTESSEKHLFAIVDNAQLVNDQTSVPGLVTFQLSSPPTTEDGEELSRKFTSYFEKSYGALRQWQSIRNNQRNIDVKHEDGSSVDDILKAAINDRVTLTLVVNPKPAKGSNSRKNVYGDLLSLDGKSFEKRQEAPLLESISAVVAATPTASRSPQSFATSAAKFPLTAQCYDTADSCNSETNSCSGHGECVLARKSPPSPEGEEGAECYQCKCGKSERTNDDGSIKTTYWGGSACQKEDISAPFWLLTITAGSLFALVGFGVSMLYAMGNVELPSVIGAGVSGPKAK